MNDIAPMPQAEDFLDECRVLHELLSQIPEEMWEEPSAFKRWTATDIIGHLYHTDCTALAALDGEDAFWDQMAGMSEANVCAEGIIAYTRRWHGLAGQALLDRWIDTARSLAETFRDIDPRRRVYWGRGPDMSARSCISARQMEAWSHGQALFDSVGRDRPESDRLRNVAQICASTFAWAFRVRELPIPERPPYLRLTAPSGAVWEWNDAAGSERITGSAVEFCQVGTQTRNIADTALVADGETARQWMAIAQCFAGAPHDPPQPGTRIRRLHGG
ncbi:MAG: TIGR03084 family metal-binding protein [Novosphingobium sp.]|nr:TIGR03084 family metal-binding protein [Novosphingobium sp.]